MSQDTDSRAGSSRAAAILGMIVTFLGGYVLGSMNAAERAPAKDPAQARRKAVPVGVSPAKGPADALVTIVEFADFQCGYCAKSLPVQRRLFQEYGGRVRWVFKNLPLSFHQRARPAALAAMAAQEQGKFWEYHDRLFMNQDKLDDDDLIAHARVLGLDVDAFRAALAQKKHNKVIDADVELAKELKVQGTPNFFINGRHFTGSMSYSRMESAVREEIAFAQKLLRDGVRRGDIYSEISKDRKPPKPQAAEPEPKKPDKATPPPSAAVIRRVRPVAHR